MPLAKSFLIGIDGGATKTKGIITTEDGSEIGTVVGGSTNQYTNTIDLVKWNLQHIIDHLLDKAQATPNDVRGICLGLAGVDKPADAKRIYNLVSTILPQSDINVVNDSIIGLFGGCLKPYGIIVISGTGSIAYGQNREGDYFRSGGWGHILGDEGSGYAIALEGMRAVCRAADGRSRQTLITDFILRALRLKKPIELMDWVKEIGGDKAKISNLAPLVFKAYEKGDAVARKILKEQANELVVTVQAVYRSLFTRKDKDIEVVVGGSNLCKSKAYFELFKQQAEKKLRNIRVILPRKEPVYGAILYLQIKYGIVEIE